MFLRQSSLVVFTLLVVNVIFIVIHQSELAWLQTVKSSFRFTGIKKRSEDKALSEEEKYASSLSSHGNTWFKLGHHEVGNIKVVLCFPFHHELDVLHLKLLTLSGIVQIFVISESIVDDRGQPKLLVFDQSKNEKRFLPFRHQILHLIDSFVPNQVDVDLGWKMNNRMKHFIGENIVSLADFFPGATILFGDADEIPTRASVEWLSHNCCEPGVTYEFASTMPAFTYGFMWVSFQRGYSTLTARSINDESKFWRNRLNGTPYSQVVEAIPLYPSGWHCSYCLSSEACVEKLRHANLADGPPFLGLFNWTTQIFDGLRACGLAPQGHDLTPSSFSHVPDGVEIFYPYLLSKPNCTVSMRNETIFLLQSLIH
jgi:hypothetical protein